MKRAKHLLALTLTAAMLMEGVTPAFAAETAEAVYVQSEAEVSDTVSMQDATGMSDTVSMQDATGMSEEAPAQGAAGESETAPAPDVIETSGASVSAGEDAAPADDADGDISEQGTDEGAVPFAAGAEELVTEITAQGTCGKTDADEVTWQIEGGTLTISGTGAMADYSNGSNNLPPWFEYKSSITAVVIGEGVTNVGNYAFYNYGSITAVTLPSTITAIGSYAFSECQKAETISLQNGVTSIGNYAFYNCKKLSSINISGDLDSIGQYAFGSCSTLAELNLPSGMTTIGNNAFDNCSAIVNLTLPGTLTSIGQGAFNNCSKLEGVTISSGITTIPRSCFQYCGKLTEVSIPNTVKKIEQDAFYRCTSLPAVTIPASVTDLGYCAFQDCSSLTDITIPAGVTNMSTRIFDGCTSLKNVTITEGVTSVTDGMFKSCAIEEITIPASVTTIHSKAFENCSSLKSVSIASGNTVYYDENGIVYLKSDNTLYIKPAAYEGAFAPKEGITNLTTLYYKGDTTVTEVTIPASVLTIDANAFEGCTALTTVNFKEGSKLKTIGNNAFKNCTSLQTVNLPEGVTTIGSSAFYGCSALTSCSVPEGVTEIADSAFRECSALTGFTLPKSVVTINSSAFAKCGNLTTFTIPADSSLTTVKSDAFWDCKKLASISLPAGLTTLGSCAFEDCDALTSLVIPENVTAIPNRLCKNCDVLASVTIKGAVTSIDYSAFEGCVALTGFTIPAGITKITSGIFKNCSALAAVTIPAGVTTIESSAFEGCTALASVTIPTGVTKIASNTFKNCSLLTSVTIPADVTVIDSSAFEGCSGLKTVTFSGTNSLLTIGSYAFKNCPVLSAITLPESVTGIGYEAFGGCKGLTTVTVPSGVTKLENYCFSNCTALKTINLPSGVTTLNTSCFSGCTALEAVNIAEPGNDTYYSKNGVIYKKSDGSVFFIPAAYNGQLDLPEGITVLTSSYYKGNTTITSVTIPASVETIDSEAFKGCTALKTVNYESGSKLKTIKSSAFYGCTALTAQKLPDSVESIGSYAFYDCTSLKTVTLSSSLTSVADQAFSGCVALTGVTLPDNLETLGSRAFYNCAGLTKISIPGKITTLYNAFENCENLATVDLSKAVSLTRIETAFNNCKALKSITIPKGVTYLSRSAFSGCDKLESINIESGNTVYYSSGGIVYLVSDDSVYIKPAANKTAEVKTRFTSDDYDGKSATVTIPASVTEIAADAFYGASKLTTVKFAKGSKLQTVGRRAFEDCTSLKTIALPEGTVSIGERAFYGCTALTKFAIPKTVTSLGTSAFGKCSGLAQITFPESLTAIGDSAFSDCSGLTQITVPASLTTIGNYAFDGCGGLTTVTVQGGTTIGNYAFSDCTALKTVTMQGGTSVGSYAFSDCTALTTVTMQGGTTIGSNAFSGCTALTTVSLAEGLTTIESYAFYKCSALKTITLPQSLTSLSVSAFDGCTALEEIIVAEGNTVYRSEGGILYKYNSSAEKWEFLYSPLGLDTGDALTFPEKMSEIPEKAFYNNESILHVVIPANVTKIGNSAFAGCKRLRSVTFEEGSMITEIGAFAFADCADLNTVVFKGDTAVASIGDYAFKNCTDLTSVTFDHNTCDTAIGKQAFYHDMSLTGLYNGAGLLPVGSISEQGFWGCQALADMRLGASCSQITGDAVFDGCRKLRSFSVDSGNTAFTVEDNVLFINAYNGCGKSLYRYPMSRIAASYSVPDGTEAICYKAFYENTVLENVSIPDSVSYIGYEAFMNSGIKRITGMKGVTATGTEVFRDCDNLSTVDLSVTSMDTITAGCFYDCDVLNEVKLPASLKRINNYAFYSCGSIRDMALPDSVETAGAYAFYSNSYWTNITIPSSLETVGDYAYYSCDGLKAINSDAPITVIGEYAFYDCDGLEQLDMPKTVQTIGRNAFYSCTRLKKISFAQDSALVSIGGDAFGYCAFEEIELPEGLTSIAGFALSRNSRLKKVVLPGSLTSISGTWHFSGNTASSNYGRNGSYLFYNCPQMEQIIVKNPELTFPAWTFWGTGADHTIYIYGVSDSAIKTYVEGYNTGSERNVVLAFTEIEKLGTKEDPAGNGDPAETEIVYPRGTFDGADAEDAFEWELSEDGTLTITGTGAMRDLYSTESAPWYGFHDRIKSVVFGEGITHVAGGAFGYEYSWSGSNLYSSLTEVELPSTLTSIGAYAFANYCPVLEKINLPDSVTKIGKRAFYRCVALDNVTLPKGLKTLEQNTFWGCAGLAHVTMQEGLERIDSYAFGNCISLTAISIPASVKKISKYAFNGCDSLTEISVNTGNTVYRSEDGKLFEITADGAKLIRWNRYIKIDGETWLYIPAEADENSFEIASYDSQISNSYAGFIVEEGNESFAVYDGALYSKDGKKLYAVPQKTEGTFAVRKGTAVIMQNAFSGCDALTEVTMPDSVYRIGEAAFYDCYFLKDLYLSKNLRDVGSSAFAGCRQLREADLPDTLQSLGYGAFQGCYNLQKVSVPGGIGRLPSYCFSGCTSLAEVQLGEGITAIGNSAFYNCDMLETVTLPYGVKKIESDAFSSCNNLRYVYIPASVEDIYYNRYVSGSYDYSYSPFDYCPTSLTICGEAGSYAAAYAARARIRYTSGSYTYYTSRINFMSVGAVANSKHYIRYMLNPDEGEQNHGDNPTTYRDQDPVIVLKDAFKEGYVFEGWYADTTYTERITRIVPAFGGESYVLYPKFTKLWTLSYTIDGEDKTMKVPDGRTMNEAGCAAPEKAGYDFAGWRTAEGNAFSQDTLVKGDMFLAPVFVENGGVFVWAPVSNPAGGEVFIGTKITLRSKTEDAVVYYTVDGSSPVADGQLTDTARAGRFTDSFALTADMRNSDGSIVVSAVAVKNNVISDVSRYTFTFPAKEDDWGEIRAQDRLKWKDASEVPGGIWLGGVPETVTYTGAKVMPEVRVYYHKLLLKEKTDYTISYKNNVNVTPAAAVGTKKAPTIVVKGKGNYKDSKEEHFVIAEAHLAMAQVQTVGGSYAQMYPSYYGESDYYDSYYYNEYTSLGTYAFTGKDVKPVPVILYNGKKLKAGKDFTMEYSAVDSQGFSGDVIMQAEGRQTAAVPRGALTAAGYYEITVRGKGNFAGTTLLRYYVEGQKDGISIKKAKITGFEKSLIYNPGGTNQQNLMLTYQADKKSDPEVLRQGYDYTLLYQNTNAMGKATVTIVGLGKYGGTVKKTYKITGNPIKKAKIAGWEKTRTYNGRYQYQSVTLNYQANKKSAAVQLVQGKDYTVKYVNNLKAGTATVIFTGMGSCTGTMKQTFKILPYDLKAGTELKKPEITVTVGDAVYSKSGIRPAVEVSYKGRILTAGTDYTVNVKNGKTGAVAMIKGKGCFKGTITESVNVKKADFSNTQITVSDVVYNEKAGGYVPKLMIRDSAGKVLKAGTDYEKTYGYAYAESTTAHKAGEILAEGAVTPAAGTVIRVTVAGCGNYEGSVSATYRIVSEDIARASVAVSKEAVYVYSGYGIVPAKKDLTVKLKGADLDASDYEIVSCVNNVKSGTATLTIRGVGGNYGGTKNVTFKITPKSMKE